MAPLGSARTLVTASAKDEACNFARVVQFFMDLEKISVARGQIPTTLCCLTTSADLGKRAKSGRKDIMSVV